MLLMAAPAYIAWRVEVYMARVERLQLVWQSTLAHPAGIEPAQRPNAPFGGAYSWRNGYRRTRRGAAVARGHVGGAGGATVTAVRGVEQQ